MSHDHNHSHEEASTEVVNTAPVNENALTRKEREELKALSMEVFGKSSRYQTFVKKGMKQLITRRVTETVPGENGAPDTTETKDVPLLVNGVKQYRIVYYSLAQIKQMILDYKVKRDEIMATMKQQQEEAKAKQVAQALEKKIQEDLGGSAL